MRLPYLAVAGTAAASAPWLLAVLPDVAIAFAPTTATSPSSPRCTTRPFFLPSVRDGTRLRAEGAPQYERYGAILREAEMVADGTAMLHVDFASVDDSEDDSDDKREAFGYQPGHVLALEIEDTGAVGELEGHTAEDTKKNGGWMRGPYTVSRATDKYLNVLIRIVGSKSKAFASAEPGTPVRFGGKFKVPIAEGITKDSKRAVLISTGVGIGPCIGAVEKILAASDDGEESNFNGKVDLFASFRTESDVPYREYLDELAADSSGKFSWTPIISSDVGRISSSEENLQKVVSSPDGVCSVTETHYHLIGNAQMVSEWKAGLLEAGVPEEKVTVELYFNHKTAPSEEAVKRIKTAVSSAAVVTSPVS